MTFIAIPFMIAERADVDAAIDVLQSLPAQSRVVVEWRLDPWCALPDSFDEDAFRNAILAMIEGAPGASIMTVRSAREGGAAPDHIDAARLVLSTMLARPRFIDVELATFMESDDIQRACMQVAASADEDAPSIILSTHDFNRRPADLLQRVAEMAAEDACAVIKVAWMARSIRDNLEAFDLLRERPKPMIALCMGPFGLMSRVLAPKFGGHLTFAALTEGEESAPGQPTWTELRTLYRFDAINASTQVYGVVGWPVEHSKSPAFHNAAFDRHNINAVYLPLPVPDAYEHFKASVGALVDHATLDFCGASVTLPHKEHLVRFVRERGGKMDAVSEACGAANTLIVHDDRSVSCINTDAQAAIDELCGALAIEPEALADRTIAVLGAGGVARAIVAALAQHGAHVFILNRSQDRAEQLAQDMSDTRGSVSVGPPGSSDPQVHVSVVLNCTSVGMDGGPDPDGNPLDAWPSIDLHEDMLVFDTIYAPEETPLLRAARACGAHAINGAGMFQRQAELQFQAWTGVEPTSEPAQ